MEFSKQPDPGFWDRWKTFVSENRSASWSYLPLWLESVKLYSAEAFLEDVSFLMTHDDRVVAICPLFLEQWKGVVGLSFAGRHAPAPLLAENLPPKLEKKIQRACYDRIDELAAEHSAAWARVMLDPLAGPPAYNPLAEFGYLDASIASTVLDLSLDESVLWSRLRKSYKSLINNGCDRFEIVIVDSKSADYEIHEQYRQLHHKTAGKVTRDKKTFDLQFEMIGQDNAILMGLRDAGRFVAFSYFFHHHGGVYYGSSSDDPDFQTDIPLEHCILFSAVRYYQHRRFRSFEIGWQHFGPQLFDHPSEKDMSISFFKRGFGGEIVPLFRGVKFYDSTFMESEIQRCATMLVEGLRP